MLWSWFVMLVLDASTWPNPSSALFEHAFTPRRPLLPAIALVWVTVLLAVALIGRLWLALGFVSAIAALLAVANRTKSALRGEPLFPTDVGFLSQPGFLVDMVPGSTVLLGLGGMAVLVAGSWAVGRLAARFFPHVTQGVGRRVVWGARAGRVLVAVVCLGLLNLATDFNDPGNAWRNVFDSQVVKWRGWQQQDNYRENGFVAGLLYNMHVDAMARPEGYSEAAVDAVSRRYVTRARRLNRGRSGSLADTNIVVVLSESFTDPTWLTTVRFPEDPIPRTRALMSRTLSGRMLAPGFGGGTANVEFEVLTGQSMGQFEPQLSVAYEQLVGNYDHYPSAVTWFEERGHLPLALHSFSARMYDRADVYEAFGFDRFVTQEAMRHQTRNDGPFIDDSSLFLETLDLMRDNSAPLFLNVVSMQNHMRYRHRFDDPINPSGLPAPFAEPAGQYARGIERTDVYLKKYIAALRKLPEPTDVVFYGDHLPGDAYPSQLEQREGALTSHQTPWFIWSNRDKVPPRQMPTVSPMQFLPMLFDALDVPVPPYYGLLHDLREQLPAMGVGMYVDANDRPLRRTQLTPEQQRVLDDYRLIQYDLSIGKRYSEETMFGDPPT